MAQPSGPPRRYRCLSAHLRQRFGAAVRSVSVDAGFTCPNVDGTVTTGGCVYCDNRSFSPTRRLPRTTIRATRPRHRHPQQALRRRALHRLLPGRHQHARPAGRDCAASIPRRWITRRSSAWPSAPGPIRCRIPSSICWKNSPTRVPVFLELGLQTIHDRSLDWMNRGHHFDAFLDAVGRCAGRNLDLCAHVILGLPGESRDDMLATARALARLPVHAVKIHNLYVVRDTPLAGSVVRGEVRLLERDEYVAWCATFWSCCRRRW